MKLYGIILLVLLNLHSFAQSVDSLFFSAREMAFSGEREQCRELCNKIIESTPEYYDASILYARTLAWDEFFDSATVILKKVIDANPSYIDAIDAITDIYKWTNKPKEGISYADIGLMHDSMSKSLRYKKAYFLYLLGKKEHAIPIVELLLIEEPENTSYQLLYRLLTDKEKPNSICLLHNFEYFTKPYKKQFSIFSLEYTRKLKRTIVIPKINVAYWHGITPLQNINPQFESDLYIFFLNKYTFYLNAGYATKDYFPDFKSGAELYMQLPHGFDASAGARQLLFASNSNYMVYTASLNKYLGNNWLSIRTYIAPKHSVGSSKTINFEFRRYYSLNPNFIAFTTGYGSSPDDILISTNTVETYFSKTLKSSIVLNHQIKKIGKIKCSIGVRYEEVTKDTWRTVFYSTAGFVYRLP